MAPKIEEMLARDLQVNHLYEMRRELFAERLAASLLLSTGLVTVEK